MRTLPVFFSCKRSLSFSLGRSIPDWRTQLGENKCRLHWFVQTELGGWIMINVRSIVGQNIAELIKNLRAHLAQQH